jgi:hypothetical protein
MSDNNFLKLQVIQLQALLNQASNDPILEPQLRERLEDAQRELASVESVPGYLIPPETYRVPRVALFLRGAGVKGTEGIRPSLAGEVLIQYERIFSEQAMHDERVAAQESGRQRRKRGTPKPELLFTGTPRGSFGLEFSPQLQGDAESSKALSLSLVHVAEVLDRVSDSSLALEQRIDDVSPRVLTQVKRFFKALATHDAELRLAFEDRPSKKITSDRIARTANLLEMDWQQEELIVQGFFRGLTRETTMFDFKSDSLGVISGMLDEGLSEEDYDRINALTNQRCEAIIQKSVLKQVSGSNRTSYVLMDAYPENAKLNLTSDRNDSINSSDN